jgi:formamidase
LAGADCGIVQVEKGGKDWERIAAEACRTIPGRENGGNCDIKNLSRGCKVYFPVFVEGANLSMGDMHFSQGDGEVSFCGAIEMSGFLELKYGGLLFFLPFCPGWQSFLFLSWCV